HFDLASCTFCGTCQDFCEEKAVTLSDDYLMFAENKEDLIVSGTRIKEKVKGKLTCADGCIYCGLCARNCPENAITVDRASKSWSVDHDKCIQCGKCISKCPKKVLSFAEPAPEGVICGSDCVFCGLCAKKCPVGAITVDRATKSWSIDREKCVQCGLCIKSCPKKTLSMGPIE
ncbi:MAG: 4Fe-4S binding protein, partial [Firmicutes bacterium]|nr:4Fe-4S binding protein [Bacillota bacterium]